MVVDQAAPLQGLTLPDGRRHVVAAANFYGPASGGLRTAVHEIGRAYRAAGHEYSLVVPGERDDVRTDDVGTIYSVASPVVPRSGGYRVITRTGAVRRLLEQLAPDRLEVSDRTTLHGLGGWAADAGVPALLIAHERLDGVLTAAGVPPQLARRLADARNRASARLFPVIVATTAFAAAELDRAGVASHRVPLGVDLETFRPQPDDPDQAVRLVLCSRLSREKSPELAIDTLLELRRRGVRASLTVAGDGPLRAALEQRAAGHPARFLGFVSDRDRLGRLLSEADVVLAPGPIETFGLAALESLACGTPVVANRSSAVGEVVGGDPAAGRGVAANPMAFADAVQALLALPPGDRRAASRGRAESFSWTSTVDALLRLPMATGAVRR